MMCSNQVNNSAPGQMTQNLNQGLHTVNGSPNVSLNGPQILGSFTPEDTLQQMDELIKENNELKEAIKQTNHAMKERYEELATWREKQRDERDYIQNKFEEAKTRLTDLTAENEILKSKIQELNADTTQGVPKGAISNVMEQDMQQLKALVSRLQTEKADLVAMNSELLLKLGAPASDDSFVEIRMEAADDGELKAAKELQCKNANSQAVYTSNMDDSTGKRLLSEELTVSQLLHMLRDKTLNMEKLEHELQSSKQRVSELEQVCEAAELARQAEKNAREELLSGTKQELAPETVVMDVSVEQQNTETAAAPVEGLNNPNNQSSNEVEALKSQVMLLVKDLQGSQKKLDEAERMKKSLNERCLDLEQQLANNQVIMEEKRQLIFSNEKLKLQVESSQSEHQIDQMKIADEKIKLAEEKRKLAQIQEAYNHLFQEHNDLKKANEEMKVKENKNLEKINDLSIDLDVAKRTMEANQQAIVELTRTVEQQADNLKAQHANNADLADISNQLEMAEKALVEKQQKIDEMKQTIIKQEEEIETVAVFRAQADVYSADFHAERAAREAIHAEKESLAERVNLLMKENTKMKEELDAFSRQSLIELQRRHSNLGAEDNVAMQQPVQRGPDNLAWNLQGVLPEHACPKCGTILPDIDTLQIHVMDCKGACTAQSIKESTSFQEALCMPTPNPKNGLLKTKSRTAQEPTNPTAVTKIRDPIQTQPGSRQVLQPLKTSNKSNTMHQEFPAAGDYERPGTSKSTNSDIAVDKFSGLRLRNPIVSSTEMERKMHGRNLIRVSQLRSKLEKLEDTDWVTFAVIIKKITSQSSNNGKTFSIWHLSDLRSSNLNLCLFLFGNVHKEHWKTEKGTVIGLLNANPMKSRDGSDEVCLSVDHPQKILIMGEALDMGTCRARKKNGDLCTQIINLMDCEYCEYHVKAQYKKLSAKRADLQSSFSGRAPNKMHGKGGSLKERLCQQGFHYGGVTSASYAASVRAAGPKKSVQTTLTHMIVKGADDIVRETKRKIALANGKVVSGCSEDFKDLMEMPTVGALNLKKHLSKVPMKGGPVNNAQSGPPILSISASELLKQQKRKLLESRKKKTEELQKRFMQSTSDSTSHISEPGGLSSLSSPKVGAEFPREQKLTAPPQTPKLGRGFAEGEDILFFDIPPPSAPKLSPTADSKKMAAIVKLRKKGEILTKEDPNCVKRKLPNTEEMPARILERIEKNLSSIPGEGNDEPTLKKRHEQLEYLDSEEFQKILNARSRHVGAVQEVEAELQEQYFEPLLKKEQMEEKMRNILELKCRVVSCKTCRYSYYKPLETCVSENHDYHWHDAIKRFFKCPCGNRAIALTRLPRKSCSNCGLFKWERDGMLKVSSSKVLMF
ncbi:hypothetical protein chiPu_0015289 [Chiloscyllium punctatum]|uniref:Protein MCM10 homolog n=1 Tax=Chiloscyllium punctatum TaxID=137246 RepID=A0A401T2D6_CHIPU|nr:hypothetical protein [Chiloscyllium punctatum]